MNLVTRKGKFDAAHRVLHERFKCFNLHGHEYHYEMSFAWDQPSGLGYAIDFKEIKRIVCDWIDERMDHGFIANPYDDKIIQVCQDLGLKLYEMHGAGNDKFCNPSAENIAKELFFAGSVLLESSDLRMHTVRLWETTNCFVDCNGLSSSEARVFWSSSLGQDLMDWRTAKGVLEYDDRKVVHEAQ